MITRLALDTIAREKLRDAEVLFAGDRYDGAVYLCGYVIELALKARICDTLKWPDFPMTEGEFKGLTSLKTHNFETLLRLSGRPEIRTTHLADWSLVVTWNPELRYQAPGTVTQTQAQSMIEATRRLLGAL